MFKYGMRLRGFGIGCQPTGFVNHKDVDSDDYYSFIWYQRKLTEEELEQFDLDYLGEDVYEGK